MNSLKLHFLGPHFCHFGSILEVFSYILLKRWISCPTLRWTLQCPRKWLDTSIHNRESTRAFAKLIMCYKCIMKQPLWQIHITIHTKKERLGQFCKPQHTQMRVIVRFDNKLYEKTWTMQRVCFNVILMPNTIYIYIYINTTFFLYCVYPSLCNLHRKVKVVVNVATFDAYCVLNVLLWV